MKGDFSKDTFRKEKHYHDVRMQQGRVLLDSDWNEQADIYSHRIETGLADVIGQNGAPKDNPGFEIIPFSNILSNVDGQKKKAQPKKEILVKDKATTTPTLINDTKGKKRFANNNIKISKGHFYVDGILCENDEDVIYAKQPDFDFTALPQEPGDYIFYLDVWQRHITALDDPGIREAALGGPDTTTRTKTVWQVKCSPCNSKTIKECNCGMDIPGLVKTTSGEKLGQLMARCEKTSETKDLCDLPASGGYTRLENQLYRVEIHNGGNKEEATFKWSRDNGSVVVKWDDIGSEYPDKLKVSSLGPDVTSVFKSGDWLELTGDKTELAGKPGILVKLSSVEGTFFKIDMATIIPSGSLTNAVDFGKNLRIRRWDMVDFNGPMKVNSAEWIPLEDGVEVGFSDGTYKCGDYWTIPARTGEADIEWPVDEAKNPISQPHRGIKHHLAKLALLKLDANGWKIIQDCRNIFQPLTELTYRQDTGNTEVSGKSCCIMVGPDQESKTLNAAIEKLIKLSISDACLCLQPGDHFINDSIDMNKSNIRTLKISGPAAFITMTAKKIHLKAEKIVLQGFSLIAEKKELDKINDAKIILSASKELIVDHCDFERMGGIKNPFIFIVEPSTIYFKNNKIKTVWPTLSLVLINGVQGLIQNNFIPFLVMQKETWEDDFSPNYWETKKKKKIEKILKDSNSKILKITNWVLNIRGNIFGTVITDQSDKLLKGQQQEVYSNIIISENIFTFPLSLFIAFYISMTNNQFNCPPPLNAGIYTYAYVLGYNVVIIGNIGLANQDSNLGIIDTLCLGKLIGEGVNLNMMEVKID